MIIIGYQGIGKSSLSRSANNTIDLESGCFWNRNYRSNDWYVYYCNIALDLSEQGNTVFTSSHQVVRDYLASLPKNELIAVCYPSLELKDEWIEKLRVRYERTQLQKDYKAWMNAVDRYDDNIRELMASPFDKIELDNMYYHLLFEIYDYQEKKFDEAVKPF